MSRHSIARLGLLGLLAVLSASCLAAPVGPTRCDLTGLSWNQTLGDVKKMPWVPTGTYCAPSCGAPLIDDNGENAAHGEEYAVKVDREVVAHLEPLKDRDTKSFLSKDPIDDLLDKWKKTKEHRKPAPRFPGASSAPEHYHLDRRNKSSPHTNSLSVPESKVKIEAGELFAQSARNPARVSSGNSIQTLHPVQLLYPRGTSQRDDKMWYTSRKSEGDGDNGRISGHQSGKIPKKPRPSSGGGMPTSAIGGHEVLSSSKPGRGDTDPTPTPSRGYHSAIPEPTEFNAGGGQNTTGSKSTLMSTADVLYRRETPGSTVRSGATDGDDTSSSNNAGAMIARGSHDYHGRNVQLSNETGIDYDTIEEALDTNIDLEIPDDDSESAFSPEYIEKITHPDPNEPDPSKPSSPLGGFTIPHISRCNSTSTFPSVTLNGTSTPISFNSTGYDNPEIVHSEIAALVECGRAQAAGKWFDDGVCTALFCKYYSGSTKAYAHSGYGVGSVYKIKRDGEAEDGATKTGNGKEGECGDDELPVGL